MSFDVSRLRRSDWITGGGAVAFFIFLFFFNWYGGSYKGTTPVGGGSFGASISSTGWDTFTNSRWIWLLTIVVAIGAALLVASQRKLELPVQPSVLIAGLGALSTLLIFYRIVHHPSGGASFAGASFSYGIKIGIWLGLIAAAAVTYGGYLMMGEDGTSLSDLGKPADRTVGDAAPPTTPSTPESRTMLSTSPTPSPMTQPTPAAAPLSTPLDQPPLPPPSPSSSGESGF
jgi:hypothetical protein